jgi:Arc/MetJ-type ribon-helix-helix transcriptional regulator
VLFRSEEDVLVKLDGLVSSGEYVSRGDAVRDILRQMIREKMEK